MSPEQIAVVRDLIVRARKLGATHRTVGPRRNREHTWTRFDIRVSLYGGDLYYSLGGELITTESVDTPDQAADVLNRWNRDWGVLTADRIAERMRNLAHTAVAQFGGVTRGQARVLIGCWVGRDQLTDADVMAVVGRFPEQVAR